MLKELWTSLRMLVALTVLTGVLYPLLVTGAAQALFPEQANGSLILREARTLGSRLIGQPFDDPRFFWGRPSATAAFPCNATASAGSNLGPTSDELERLVKERVQRLRAERGGDAPIPVDLVTASGSGLDPHISPAAAMFQVPRVAEARGLGEADVLGLIERHVEERLFVVFGEARVNVLELNLALEGTTVP